MKPVDNTGQSWQRVKVAVTGLVAVLALIGLASVVVGSARRASPTAAAASARPDLVANLVDANAAAPGEPLAELGVTPSTQANAAAPAAMP